MTGAASRPADSSHSPGAAPNHSPATATPFLLGERAYAGSAPWLVVACGAIAYGISDALHRGALPPLTTLLTIAGLVTAALGAVWLAHRGESGRRQLALVVSALVLVCITIGAPAATLGLSAVTMPAIVLVAAYAGLTVPRSGLLLGALLVAMVALHVAHPLASTLDAASLLAIVAVGWLFGRFCGAVHLRARRLAMRLARTDRLVHTLNRRGFTEELAHRLATAQPTEPVALMVLDLVDFKEVNERLGAAAGDALLERVGNTLAELLPPTAIAGRLGGDEFAIAISGRSDKDALALAHQLQRAVGELHPARVGLASAQHSQLAVGDLLRSADGAARRARTPGEEPVQHLVAGQTSAPAPAQQAATPVLTYAALRELGGRPVKPGPRLLDGRAQRDGFLWLAAAGAVVWLAHLADGPQTTAQLVVAYGGFPWLLVCLGFALRGARQPDKVAQDDVMVLATALASGGIAFAAAASGGLLTPAVGGLYLMVLVATALAPTQRALLCCGLVLIAYGGLVLASPSEQLWAAPFQLTMLGGALALGRVSRKALDGVTQEWLLLARTDLLTGLMNRFGFSEELRLRIDAAPHGTRFAILALDLNDFRSVNAGGYQAGDQLLRAAAAALADATPRGLSARRGADEFVAAVEISEPGDADRLLPQVRRAVAAIHPVSAGVAVYPDDGDDPHEVARIADLRARTDKLQAHAEGLR